MWFKFEINTKYAKYIKITKEQKQESVPITIQEIEKAIKVEEDLEKKGLITSTSRKTALQGGLDGLLVVVWLDPNRDR